MTCPVCLADAKTRKTNRKHPQLANVYCQCSNMECGHSFVMNVSFSHTISPSTLSGQGRVKELIHWESMTAKRRWHCYRRPKKSINNNCRAFRRTCPAPCFWCLCFSVSSCKNPVIINCM
ncbi:ogr/Delta-like zinc finger family protein [Cronobacter turicensis]